MILNEQTTSFCTESLEKCHFPFSATQSCFLGFSSQLLSSFVTVPYGSGRNFMEQHIFQGYAGFYKKIRKTKSLFKKNSEETTLINWKLSGMEFTLEDKILYWTKRFFTWLIYFSWAFIICKCIISFSFNINTKSY